MRWVDHPDPAAPAATTKDAAGNTLSGRSVTWTSSDQAAATVSTAGLVTGVTAGSVTLTASSEGRSGTASVGIFDPARIPFLSKPFAEPVDLRTTNYHDHDIPKQFVDNNGTYVPFWGEPSVVGLDGHMPVGSRCSSRTDRFDTAAAR